MCVYSSRYFRFILIWLVFSRNITAKKRTDESDLVERVSGHGWTWFTLVERALQSTVLQDWTPLVICREGFEVKHFEWGRPVSIKRWRRGGELSSPGAVGAGAPRHSGRTQELNRDNIRETGTRRGGFPHKKRSITEEHARRKRIQPGIRSEYIMKHPASAAAFL